MLQAPVAIYISLQLLIAHIRKSVHAFAFNALNVPKRYPAIAYKCPGARLIGSLRSWLFALGASLFTRQALVLQAPVAINISLQLLIAHVRKLVHALALYALNLQPH